MTSQPLPVPVKLMLEVSGLDAGKFRIVQLPSILICEGGTGLTKPSITPPKLATQPPTDCARAGTALSSNRPKANSRILIQLFAFGLLLLSAVPARAQSVGGCVANFGGVIDGFVNPVPPSQINIDGNCTIRNFPASNPLTSNISFTGTGRGWLVIFDNVDFTGNLSCDKSHGNFIWFVNGSITGAHVLGCANLFVPVDKIDKENPPGPPFVSIGVPFTYTLTFPQLVSATTGAVVNPNGSNVEVDQVTVTDNLNATEIGRASCRERV